MLAHTIGLWAGVKWPSMGPVWVLSMAPFATGLLTVEILAPGAYRYNPFASDVWDRWSQGTRFVVKTILRIGWFGKIAALAVLFHLHIEVLGASRLVAEVVASSLISLLYASQVLVLHFGQIREPEPSDRPLPE